MQSRYGVDTADKGKLKSQHNPVPGKITVEGFLSSLQDDPLWLPLHRRQDWVDRSSHAFRHHCQHPAEQEQHGGHCSLQQGCTAQLAKVQEPWVSVLALYSGLLFCFLLSRDISSALFNFFLHLCVFSSCPTISMAGSLPGTPEGIMWICMGFKLKWRHLGYCLQAFFIFHSLR